MADVDEHQKIASLSGSPLKNRSSNEEEGSALKVRFLYVRLLRFLKVNTVEVSCVSVSE